MSGASSSATSSGSGSETSGSGGGGGNATRGSSVTGDGWLEVERFASSQLEIEVHAGDFLDFLSRGYFAAMRHRVVRPLGGPSRVSCPLLLRPREAWRRERGWLQWTERDSDLSSEEEEEEEEADEEAQTRPEGEVDIE